MIVPFTVDVPLERWPWTNWAIMGLSVVLSIGLFASDGDSDVLILWRDDFGLMQLLGYQYAHGDVLHLLGNMVFLFCFGNAVNAKLGHLQYLLAYHAFGVAAGLAWLATGSGEAMVGASGAIMGVVGMFIVLFPTNDVKLFYWFGFAFVGTVDVAAYWVIGIYFAFDVWGLAASHQDGVAYIAHVAGVILGAATAIALLKAGFAQPSEHERNLLQVLAGQSGDQEPPRVKPRQATSGSFEPQMMAAPMPSLASQSVNGGSAHSPVMHSRLAGGADGGPTAIVTDPVHAQSPAKVRKVTPGEPLKAPAATRSPAATASPVLPSESSYTPAEPPDPYGVA